jgi:sulfoxide reductase heme-binding subunit YedZ
MLLLATSAAGPTLQLASNRVSTSWTWYIVRAAGFAAAGLLILLMLSGIGQVTGLTYRFIEPIKAWALHKAMALALCVAIALHVIFIFVDHYLPFSLTQLLIPFGSSYTNKVALFSVHLGSLAVTAGIIAMYGVAIIVLSSLGWIDTKKKAWRWLHYLSYLVMLLVFVHALSTGTDLKYGTFRTTFTLMGLAVLFGVVSRLWRAGTLRKKPPKSDDEPTS